MIEKTSKTRSDLKREQILKVAGQLFMEHGYNAVTMDAIAEATPVSKPTLYNHFENKYALFSAVSQMRTDAMFRSLQNEIKSDKPIPDTLKLVGMAFLERVSSPEAIKMYRNMISESMTFPELGQLFYQHGPMRMCELIAGYLAEQHASGKLHVPNPQLSANFFFNMLKSNAHMKCMMQLKDKIPPKERREIVDYAVFIFLNGHRPNA